MARTEEHLLYMTHMDPLIRMHNCTSQAHNAKTKAVRHSDNSRTDGMHPQLPRNWPTWLIAEGTRRRECDHKAKTGHGKLAAYLSQLAHEAEGLEGLQTLTHGQQ